MPWARVVLPHPETPMTTMKRASGFGDGAAMGGFWLIDEGHRLARGGPNCKRQNASAPASSVYTIAIRRYRPPKHGNTETRHHELVLLGLCPGFHLLRPLADFPLE